MISSLFPPLNTRSINRPGVLLEERKDVGHPDGNDVAVISFRDFNIPMIQLQFLHRFDPLTRVFHGDGRVLFPLYDDHRHHILERLQAAG